MLKDVFNSAASLYDGGWRSTDKEELMKEHDLTEEDAELLCLELAKFEKEEV